MPDTAATRADFPHVCPLDTRWADNDLYGHVNNVTYYAYFDSVVNRYLIEAGGLDIHDGPVIGLVVESGCRYHAPVAFPDRLEAGLRVAHLGNRSVTYELGIFRVGETEACAEGRFVHVFVDRHDRRAVPIPDPVRAALARLTAPPPDAGASESGA